MKMQLSIKWLIGLVTLACAVVALYSWHLREIRTAADAAASAATQHEKIIQEHADVYSHVSRILRDIGDQRLSTYVNSLPGKKSYQKVQLTQGFMVDEKDSKKRTLNKYTYEFKLKDKTFVEFHIVGGYFRDHLDPHVFEIRYTDTPNNKSVVDFIENLFRTVFKYPEGRFKFEHKIVESFGTSR